MGSIPDPRIIDAAGRVRNLDREGIEVLISEFIARALMSRHRDGAISYGNVWVCWSPIPTALVNESGVCCMTMQSTDAELLVRIEELLIHNHMLCDRLETYTEDLVEYVYHVKLRPVGTTDA